MKELLAESEKNEKLLALQSNILKEEVQRLQRNSSVNNTDIQHLKTVVLKYIESHDDEVLNSVKRINFNRKFCQCW